MRLLVCGGRDFCDKEFLENILDKVHAAKHVDVLIEGGARGADRLAAEWGLSRGIPTEEYKADWNEHGKKAGPIRNKLMLEKGCPDGVVAFAGGAGTRNMVTISKQAKIPVWEPCTLRNLLRHNHA